MHHKPDREVMVTHCDAAIDHARTSCASPANLVVNGSFDSPGYDADGGRFLQDQEFNGWTMDCSAVGGARVMQVWFEELGMPLAGPFPYGPWAGLNGTISQTIPTKLGGSYLLCYSSRAAGWSTRSPAADWEGGNICDVFVNGRIAQTVVTVTEPLYTPYQVHFIATSTETVLSFGVWGSDAVGIDQVSVIETPFEKHTIPSFDLEPGYDLAALANGSLALYSNSAVRCSPIRGYFYSRADGT